MLVVEYNFRSFKMQTTPGTLLVEAKNAACASFGLDPLEYTLAYKGKSLDLTVPLRFTSLVNGARLSLEKVNVKSQARVKLRLSKGDFVGSFPLDTRIWQVIEAAGASGVAFLADQQVPNDKTLLEIGVNGSAVFSVRPEKAPQPAKVPLQDPRPIDAEPTEVPEHCNGDNASLSPQGPQLTAVSPEPIPADPHLAAARTNMQRPTVVEHREQKSNIVAPTGDVPGPTIMQAQGYLAHLRSQAAPRPMVSKSTLQSMRQEKRMQQDINIRIRLPDMSILGGVFKPTETGAHVYNFVRGLLASQAIEFTLETVPPGFELKPCHNLVADTDFDSRVLLELKTTSKGPFLNEKALEISQAAVNTLKGETQKAQHAPEIAPDTARKAPSKQKPKWFKLGK